MSVYSAQVAMMSAYSVKNLVTDTERILSGYFRRFLGEVVTVLRLKTQHLRCLPQIGYSSYRYNEIPESQLSARGEASNDRLG